MKEGEGIMTGSDTLTIVGGEQPIGSGAQGHAELGE